MFKYFSFIPNIYTLNQQFFQATYDQTLSWPFLLSIFFLLFENSFDIFISIKFSTLTSPYDLKVFYLLTKCNTYYFK